MFKVDQNCIIFVWTEQLLKLILFKPALSRWVKCEVVFFLFFSTEDLSPYSLIYAV